MMVEIYRKITKQMANNGGNCPVCGKFIRPNGVGPDDTPELTTILNNLPSNHLLKYGANFHDWFYHIGGSDVDRYVADLTMFFLNKDLIRERCRWYSSWFYHLMNYRNYLFVREFGSNFFGKDGCNSQNESQVG